MLASERLIGRTAESLVTAAAIFFAQSGRKGTPKARKGAKRDLIPDPPESIIESDQRARFLQRGGKRWAIVVKRQNKPDTHILTDNQNDERRRVPNVGTAKNSWSGMLRMLNKRAPTVDKGVGKGLGKARKTGTKDAPEVTLINTLSYLPNIAPDIQQQALDKTTRRMEKNLDRQVGNALKRMW
jgi:hypothetical protein